MKTKITCDQVAWLLDVFNRHLPPSPHVAISAARECQMHAMLYEVMEVAGLEFEDANAAWNAIPKRWQHFGPKEATDANVNRAAVDRLFGAKETGLNSFSRERDA